jgi:transposase
VATKLEPEQIKRALELRRKCWTHERIAAEFNVSRETISRVLSRVNKRALKRLVARIASVKAEQIGQLEYLIEEAAEAWHRSKLDEVTTKTTTSTGEDSETTPYEKTAVTEKGQAGDAQFLREARGAMSDIRKILGLDSKDEREQTKLDLQRPDHEDDDGDFVIDLSDDADDEADSGPEGDPA